MDAIHYHVRSEGRIVKKTVYIAIGINLDGRKEVLGMYVGENESAKYWLSILNGLKNRGVEDILITCIDGLTGFPEGNIGSISESGNTAVCNPSDTQQHEICILQGHKGTDGRSEKGLCSNRRRNSTL